MTLSTVKWGNRGHETQLSRMYPVHVYDLSSVKGEQKCYEHETHSLNSQKIANDMKLNSQRGNK